MRDIKGIKNIAVIGGGIMGRGIAQVFLMAGFQKVVIYDIISEVLDDALKKIKIGLDKSKKKGLIEERSVNSYMKKLFKETNFSLAIIDADFIIEAVTEDIKIKLSLYEILGKFAPNHTIFASNTSTIKVTDLAEVSKRSERVVGMHFFLPPVSQCCVEVMKTEKTDDRIFNLVIEIGKNLPCLNGKNRFVAQINKDSPGFIANRLLLTPLIYLNWIADQAKKKEIPFEQLDADAGNIMPMGPFELNDYLGLDVAYYSLKNFEKYVSPDFAPGKILSELISEGKYGRKTGCGFYNWNKDGKPQLDKSKRANFLNPEIILAIQLNEGCKLLEQGIVPGYKVIEDVMIKGPGIPGPFSAGKRKYQYWSKLLEDLVKETGKNYLQPCKLMTSGNFINMRK